MNRENTTQNDFARIQLLTRMDASEIKSLFHYYAQLTFEEHIIIERLKSEIIGANLDKCKQVEKPQFFYAMFITAIANFKQEKVSAQKGINTELQSKIEDLRLKRLLAEKNKRQSPLKKFIMRNFGKVEQLRQNGLGFREISKYFRDYHNKKISHTYIRRIFQEANNVSKQ